MNNETSDRIRVIKNAWTFGGHTAAKIAMSKCEDFKSELKRHGITISAFIKKGILLDSKSNDSIVVRMENSSGIPDLIVCTINSDSIISELKTAIEASHKTSSKATVKQTMVLHRVGNGRETHYGRNEISDGKIEDWYNYDSSRA